MDTDRSSNQASPICAAISRRAALGRLAGAGLAAGLLSSWPNRYTGAQSTPGGEDPRGANHFVLTGGKVRITYDTTAFAGEPQLTYRGPIGPGPIEERPIESRTIVGDDVHTQQSELGRLVTVYLDAIPDAATFHLTLLLPEINLSSDGAPTPFATLAIRTVHLTTIGGPASIEGALQVYEVVTLEGTAEFVGF